MTDLTTVVSVLVGLSSLIWLACGPIITAAILKHIKIAKNSALAQDIDNAVSAGGRIALDAIQSFAAHNGMIDIKNVAIQRGVQEVVRLAPLAVSDLGLSEDWIARQISGELAKVLGVAIPPALDVTSAPVVTPISVPTPLPPSA